MRTFRLLPLIPVSMLAACGSAEPPEQQIQRVIEQIDAAVESHDSGKLAQLLSAEYQDASGMSRDEAVRHVSGYFDATHQLYVMPMIAQIEFPHRDEARVRMGVTMLREKMDAARHFERALASYEFKLALRQEGGQWKVSFAEWRPH